MSTADQRARYASTSAGVRVFALIVLAGPVAVDGDYGSIINVIMLAAVWMGAIFADGIRHIPVVPALVVETSLVTFLAGLTLQESAVLLPALVIPTFIGGLVRGTRGAFEVLGAEVVILAASTLPNTEVHVDKDMASLLFTWLMASLGFGLVASYIHRARLESATASSYRDARYLITRLLDLSGELVDGLDPLSISQNILDLAREEVPITGAVIYSRSDFGVTPLLDGDVRDRDEHPTELVESVFASGKAVVDGPWAAFPLVTEAGVVAVVAGVLLPSSRPAAAHLRGTMTEVVENLRAEALQLDTALLFSAVRNEATAEERRRLARDLHDGVAQDIASLGYMIDDLVDSAESDDQAERGRNLRTELTRVVTELRRSVFLLRNEATGGATLGESIRALASHIETRSGVRVAVELDEADERLRPDIEAEILRIAQEGINNAVRHARASRITVSCRVRAPAVEVEVVDDGRGLQPAREDSHGIRIMRERARRIGADLQLRNAESRSGTVLTVAIRARADGSDSRLEGIAT